MPRHSREELAEVLKGSPQDMWTRSTITKEKGGNVYACAYGRALNILGITDMEELTQEQFKQITGIEPVDVDVSDSDYGWSFSWIRTTLDKIFNLDRPVPEREYQNLGRKMESANDSYGYEAAATVLLHPEISMDTICDRYGWMDSYADNYVYATSEDDEEEED
jgi:hypothetical protein